MESKQKVGNAVACPRYFSGNSYRMARFDQPHEKTVNFATNVTNEMHICREVTMVTRVNSRKASIQSA